jgi:hypothetical protein
MATDIITGLKQSAKHHYIPKFYLKGFTDPGNGFYVYDKKLDKIWKSNPDNSFFDKYRNMAIDKHVDTQEIIKSDYPEQLISYYDSQAACAIADIRNSDPADFVLTDERLYRIRLFIASLFWRSPANDKIREEFIRTNSFQDMGFRFQDKDGNRDRMFENMVFASDLFKKLYPWVLPRVSFQENNVKLNAKEWKLLYKKETFHIVTDNPIIHPQFKHFSFVHEDIIFPISATRLLISTKKYIPAVIPPVFSLRVDLLLFLRAHRFVASSDRKYLEWLVSHVKQYSNESGWISGLPNKIWETFY